MKHMPITIFLVASIGLSAAGCAKKQKATAMLTEVAEQPAPDAAADAQKSKTAETNDDTNGGMRRPIFFAFDSSELSDESRRELSGLAADLKRVADMSVTIEGNTDSRGTTEYNLALGERRAKAAKDYITRLGVDGRRVAVVSYGEERPAAAGESDEAFAKNRRDEFVVND